LEKEIEISTGFSEDESAMREAFRRLSDEERFFITCQLSEIMVRIQYENGVLPEETNFTLTNE